MPQVAASTKGRKASLQTLYANRYAPRRVSRYKIRRDAQLTIIAVQKVQICKYKAMELLVEVLVPNFISMRYT